MISIKKTAMALCLLSSGYVVAGTMGPVCTEISSTIPCEESAWEFGAQALYLQASSGLFTLIGNNTQPLGTDGFYDYPTPYAWGFKVLAGYHFSTGSDVNLNWYYDQNTDAFTARNVWNFKDNNWNAVNLEVGQKVNYGNNKYIRFHGGVNYSRIYVNYRQQAIGANFDTPPVPAFQTSTVRSSYNGFGPRLGADMNYLFGHGVSIYANGAAALLVGGERFSNLMTLEGLPNTSNGGKSTVVVPELEAKLGATYTHPIASGQLTLDAGWMWINYFNAYLYDRSVNSVIGNQYTSTNNFSLQGPFFGLKWLGNMA